MYKLEKDRVLYFLLDLIRQCVLMEDEVVNILIQEIVKMDHVVTKNIRQ